MFPLVVFTATDVELILLSRTAPFTFVTCTFSNWDEAGTNTLMVAAKVCENRIPALAGNVALKIRLPLDVELVRMIVDNEDPSPLAVSVPLTRIEDCDQG